MTEKQSAILDQVFSALGHPIRRQILARLRRGPATVTDIAAPFDTSLNAISKHLKVLEKAGLIERDIIGREHYCRLNLQPLEAVAGWLAYYQAFWTSHLDAMEQVLMAGKQRDSSGEEEADSTQSH